MFCDHLKDKTVLITGGTKGVGKAAAIEFAKYGAKVVITHKWGSVDEKEIVDEFKAQQLTPPMIVQSDVSNADDIADLMQKIKEAHQHLDVIVSNVAFSKIINSMDEMRFKTLELSLMYSAWPLVSLTKQAKDTFSKYPKYVIAISSDGPDVCHPGYDMAGASKAVLETLTKYLALRLKKEGVRVNALRPGMLVTASSTATFGEEVMDKLFNELRDIFITPEAVAEVCVALCSGLMDSITGQIINVDAGGSLISPISYISRLGLPGQFLDE